MYKRQPVAHLLHKILQRPGSFWNPVILQMSVHRGDQGVETGQQPAIHHRQRLPVQGITGGVEIVDIGIEYKESVSVPQGGHKLALPLLHRLAVETIGQPGGGIAVEIPADGVRAIGIQRLKGIHRVALGFGHLLPKMWIRDSPSAG